MLNKTTYNPHTVELCGERMDAYKVHQSELHLFLSDMADSADMAAYREDIMLDYRAMMDEVVEGVGYMWHIRKTGTYFSTAVKYPFKDDSIIFSRIVKRFTITKRGSYYHFVEFKPLDLSLL